MIKFRVCHYCCTGYRRHDTKFCSESCKQKFLELSPQVQKRCRRRAIDKKKTTQRKPRPRKLVCSHCGEQQSLTRTATNRAARVRCTQCGGPMNLPTQA